jgi:hypothetical protein
MQIHDAIRLMKEACALKHPALHTEKTYTHWLTRFAAFLRDQQPNLPVTTEQKIEDFLTNLALSGDVTSGDSLLIPFPMVLQPMRCKMGLLCGICRWCLATTISKPPCSTFTPKLEGW